MLEFNEMEFPQQDKDLLRGVIDLHVHTMPSVYDRPFDALALSRQGRAVGYRAILFKCHHAINADCMYIVRKTVPGIEAFGGVVLNRLGCQGGMDAHDERGSSRQGLREGGVPLA
jgi:hypothetical protein